MKAVLEGILFLVGDEGISKEKLEEILEIDEIDKLIEELKNDCQDNSRGLTIEKYGSKYKMTTKKEHKKYYEKLVNIEKNEELSQAALETLAIVAYNQPVTRAYIDEVRGVDSSHMVRKLLLKNLIKEIGKSDLPGRPNIYSVTDEFLDYMGIKSIEELPKLEEVQMDEETNLFEAKYKEES